MIFTGWDCSAEKNPEAPLRSPCAVVNVPIQEVDYVGRDCNVLRGRGVDSVNFWSGMS